MIGRGPVGLGRLSPDGAQRILDRLGTSSVTYDRVGSTLGEPDPTARAGIRVRTHRRELGHGSATFGRAVDALRGWAAHAGLGAQIAPVRPPIEVGTNLLVVLPVGPIRVVVPDRIVAVVDEPTRFGFAYGTLPGHPERGEESFVVELGAHEEVTLTIRIDARPAWRGLRPVAPVLGWLQDQAARRYLQGVAHALDADRVTDGGVVR